MTLPGVGSRGAGGLGPTGRTLRRAWLLATGLTATLGLALAESAAPAQAAPVQSTTLAGYDFNAYIGVPGSVSALIVVPKLSCSGTPSAGAAVDAGVGIQSVNSFARLSLACTAQGVASYTPSLIVDGTTKTVAGDAAQPGDMVELAVSQSDSIVTVSVIDLTHAFNATSNGTGSGTGEGILVGDFPAVAGGTTLAVPDFGTVAFSSATVNGYPIGATGTGLQTDNLYAGSKLQVAVHTSAVKESFTTVFA